MSDKKPQELMKFNKEARDKLVEGSTLMYNA